MAEDIAQWLDRLGLGQYAPAFAENAVELSHLPHLTDDDLKELGLPLGPRRHLQAAIVGEAPNLAARLQEIAEPDTVVIASNTHRLAGRLFESRSLGEQSFKGFDTPIIAWTVLRPRQIATRFEALTSDRLTALMGRDEERDALGRRWRRAQDGDGQAVLISGEAGIGKSRLVHTLMDDIEREPHLLVQIQFRIILELPGAGLKSAWCTTIQLQIHF